MHHVENTTIDWVRWLFYLLAFLPLGAWLFFGRDRVNRLIALIGTMIFIQDSLAGRRWVWAFSLTPAFMLLYVLLVSQIFAQRRLPQLGVFAGLWIAYLSTAVLGLIIGSLGTGLLATNLDRFQVIYFEGFFYFLYGLVALRGAPEVMRFTRLTVLVGAGVAAVHFFTLITGFRFRNAGVAEYGMLNAGVLDNTNALGSFYVLVIPVSLSLLVRQRLTALWRALIAASLVAMLGSLVLSGSRGGYVFTLVVGFVALAWSRMGATRAIAAAILAGLLGAISYYLMSTLLPNLDILGVAQQKGLETDRFSLFYRYLLALLDHPLGIGLASQNFINMIAAYGIPGVVNAHNIFLEQALESGILGLLAFLGITGTVLANNRRAYRQTTDPVERDALLYLFLPVFGFLAVGFFEPNLSVYPKLNNYFWLLCGLSVGASGQVFAARRAALRDEPPFGPFLSDAPVRARTVLAGEGPPR